MKYLLFLGLVFNVQAQNMFANMDSEELAEYEITITHKPTNKVVGKMSRAEYKVVRIGSSNYNLFSPFIEADLSRSYEVGKMDGQRMQHYSFIGMLSVGAVGLKQKTEGNVTEVSQKQGPIFTGLLCDTSGRVGACVSGNTNKSFGAGLKVDFN
jgi:hypothetical protein